MPDPDPRQAPQEKSPQATAQPGTLNTRGPALLAMAIGAKLWLASVSVMAEHSLDLAASGQDKYNAMFMAFAAFMVAFGFSRDRSLRRSVSGKAKADMIGEVVPYTLGLTILGLFIGSALA